MPVVIKHRNKPPVVKWEYGFIGEPPLSAQFGSPLVDSLMHSTNWPCDVLLDYSGPPDAAVNLDDHGMFYVIWNRPYRWDGTSVRKVGIAIRPWCKGDTMALDPQVDWYPVYDAVSYSGYSYRFKSDSAADTYGDHSNMTMMYVEGTYTPLNEAFGCSKIRLHDMMVASLTVFHMPPAVTELTSAVVPVTNKAVEVGQPIKGFDGTTTDTFGNLIHMTGEGADSSKESGESMTRRCLFQWGHPGGWYIPVSETHGMGDFMFRFKLRNLTNDSTGSAELKCLPACVVSGGDADCSITFRTYDHASVLVDSWTYEWPAGGWWSGGVGVTPVPHLVVPTDGTTDDIDAPMDLLGSGGEVAYCAVHVTTGAGQPCAVHTVALFEGAEW